MRSPKSRDKRRIKEAAYSDPVLTKLDEFLPTSNACSILKYLDDSDKMVKEMITILENQNFPLYKPVRHHPKPGISFKCDVLDNAKQGKSRAEDCFVPVPKHGLNPDADLWDAAVIDYFIRVCFWGGKEWPTELGANYSLLPSANIPDDAETQRLVCLRVAFSTVYLLLCNSQMPQPTPSAEETASISSSIGTEGSSNVMASVRFLKSLFRSPTALNCPLTGPLGDQPNQLENRYAGLLYTLDRRAGELLLNYINTNLLSLHRILERTFAPNAAELQELVEMPCELYFNALPKCFGRTHSVWPPPLSESLPLSLIAKYPDLFEMKVTKWVKYLPEETEEEARPEEQTVEEEPKTESPEPVEQEEDYIGKLMDKYLSLVDLLPTNELEALSHLTAEEGEEIIKNLVREKFANEDDSMKPTIELVTICQLSLSKNLIQRANEKLKILENTRTSPKQSGDHSPV
ncbi:unnamed protein product [Calicophoron daubneyi]|uniref:Uncharacterized protein n=1 Tax=Calicophoron daubneyi TaxID=300641 RepID=A0AAV2T0Z6_CALDB